MVCRAMVAAVTAEDYREELRDASRCSPTRQHILLVPLTEVLLDSRDIETGAPLVDAIATDEFLGSHVLRIPVPKGNVAGGKDVAQNLREMRGKARQYGTINGRMVVIKDNLVYGNKGFRSLAHANLLHDAIWYPDSLDPKSFLIYYISRPLVGSWDDTKAAPAVLSARQAKDDPPERDAMAGTPRKKDIKNFHSLLNNFPVIAKQMQPGLEKLFVEFTRAYDQALTPPSSAVDIPDAQPDGPITVAVKRARSESVGLGGVAHALENVSSEDDEDVMKVSLETAVTTAIDIFQSVDKQQLSQLGATTDLTGPVVERLIERYITENVHNLLFPRLVAFRRPDDLELEAKIRQMEFIDIAQLGLVIEGGSKGKRDLISRLGRAVEEFRKMHNAMGPQEMMDILLSTTKAATMLPDRVDEVNGQKPGTEKAIMTINADTLVSLLLYVVIRAQVKYLGARLAYIRNFIFIDDVENGEMGYALSTFEAVLQYLDRDSGGLRKASRRNKALWDTVAKGDMLGLKAVMEPTAKSQDDSAIDSRRSSRRPSSSGWSFTNGHSSQSSTTLTVSERFSLGSGLHHVFPFQNGHDGQTDDDPSPPPKRIKKVAMDTRSMSSGSEMSYRSRASIGTWTSGVDGDTSIERLSRTQNSAGESMLMMAVQNRQPDVLRYLLSLEQHYPPDYVLEDGNNEGTTVFSAAVQLGHAEMVNTVLDFLFQSLSDETVRAYVALQDVWGRSAAHYLFHSPFLIAHIGKLLAWRQKDKNGQTPLFALCRSYDHPSYVQMVEEALDAATWTQRDGQPLHVDDHVDGRGNTLLHIVNEPKLAVRILQQCDVEVNATNDKRFTALMLASKYGRFDMARILFSDPRVDVAAREMRGLTAVELAKDDEVRNKMDDLGLFALGPGTDQRTTGVIRSYFVEDASVRFVVKSGAPVDQHSYAVTTCRRSLGDFEHLHRLLEMENPASWIPSLDNLRSPTQIPSRPSRAVLRDLQVRMDWFLRVLLLHPTFATHEMLWEFFLVPDLQLDSMEQRSKLKAAHRAEKVRDELDPVEDVQEVEQFVDHARGMVRSVHVSTRSVARRANVVGNVGQDLHEASRLLSKAVATLPFLPDGHKTALDVYVRSVKPAEQSPINVFFTTFLALSRNTEAVIKALERPQKNIMAMKALSREAERSASRPPWPLAVLHDTRQRLNEEREARVRRSEAEAELLEKELRYTQQTVAAELAGWRDMHDFISRKAVRELASAMLIAERGRLDQLRRAQRALRVLDESKVVDASLRLACARTEPSSSSSSSTLAEAGTSNASG